MSGGISHPAGKVKVAYTLSGNKRNIRIHLSTASFDSEMRRLLLDFSALDWCKILRAIFGFLFQSVMNPQERRNLGAHYTSEKNILKVNKPLFDNDLWKKSESLKSSKQYTPPTADSALP